MVNNLINETSPYLLQHAYNPVDWYSWNKNTLKKARQENKLIFLSIGYSSCHWCHVMAHETFENNDIAKIMNKHFINIKVDREERPDIDDIYQKVCQILIGQGGWPLSVFLTQEQNPIFIGTYFPPYTLYSRLGFSELLLKIVKQWNDDKTKIEKNINKLLTNIKNTRPVVSNTIDKLVLDESIINLSQLCDNINGGFGNSPKFPNSLSLSFMLRYSKLYGISKFNRFVFKTLHKMADGGIFDQLDGGFHRYSVDEKWLVPHFEKMLYDNALLPIVYIEAYQITKDQYYLDIVKKTLDYVSKRLLSLEGGFYSSQDADSEGEEGIYYLWTKKEIENILGNDANIFCTYYNITENGNFDGNNILYNGISSSVIASKFNISEKKLKKIIDLSIEKLLKIRLKRTSPGLDDKIITSWNALMVTAFIKAYRVSNEKKFFIVANNCINFIKNNLIRNGQVLHTYKNNISKIPGYLDDYAYLINALLDLFEVYPIIDNLKLAQTLAEYLLSHFWDQSSNSFYMTSDANEKLIIRPKNSYDLSLPSGNSVAAHAFLRLYHLTHNKILYEISIKIIKSHIADAANNPFAYGYLLNVAWTYLKNPIEIIITNTENKDICNFVNNTFIPESISIIIQDKYQLNDLTHNTFFTGKKFNDDYTTVYVCKDLACSLPLKSVLELKDILN